MRHIRTKGRNIDGRTTMGPYAQTGSRMRRTKGSSRTFCGADVSDNDMGDKTAADTIRLHKSVHPSHRPQVSDFWAAIEADFSSLCPACVAALEAKNANP